MRRDPRALLADVLDAARSIERFREGIDLDGFRADELVRAGIERKLEIVGEALNRLILTRSCSVASHSGLDLASSARAAMLGRA